MSDRAENGVIDLPYLGPELAVAIATKNCTQPEWLQNLAHYNKCEQLLAIGIAQDMILRLRAKGVYN